MVLSEDRVKELMKENFRYLIETNKEVFFSLFEEFFIEMMEDRGMLNALKEISPEDSQVASEEEIAAFFNKKFTTQN